MSKKSEKLLVKGHEVHFGESKINHLVRYDYGGDRDCYHRKVQKWTIPTLDLYGWVDIEDDRWGKASLASIKRDIEREVTYDLEQREKRRLGIA